MTVPFERTNAVLNTEQFLLDLLDPKKTPRIPKAIRQRARGLLRHYPSKFNMDVVSGREDKMPDFSNKVFGKGWK